MLLQSQTGSLLHQDHMTTIETLQGLEELLGRHRQPPALDDGLRASLIGLSTTLKAEVESHFAFEEGHLFPAFVAKGETGIVMMLTHEHRSILPLALRVAELAVQAATAGFDEQSWRDFRDSGGELVEREIFHIQKEEMGLLAAISALLDEGEDATLAAVYRQTVK
ncbi:hemerythrin domain-containing protein [Magnetospirillum sulfuroxidans]|uniref:hemerythrin domain-containing protein n=1 Tax=Magnetospirillum sulfuroxidans TaxID=611300 RepID=UPI002012792F|nr:hemerythrin domain-containing protein [Magnetospirillum sulfuroxidans]